MQCTPCTMFVCNVPHVTPFSMTVLPSSLEVPFVAVVLWSAEAVHHSIVCILPACSHCSHCECHAAGGTWMTAC